MLCCVVLCCVFVFYRFMGGGRCDGCLLGLKFLFMFVFEQDGRNNNSRDAHMFFPRVLVYMGVYTVCDLLRVGGHCIATLATRVMVTAIYTYLHTGYTG